jgi:hypothetical protein
MCTEVKKNALDKICIYLLFSTYFLCLFVFYQNGNLGKGCDSPQWARTSSFTKFLDHTKRRTTVGETSLDEWSARHTDLYLTTHSTHYRQTSIPPAGFDPTISAGERPQTYALDCAATGTGIGESIRLFCRTHLPRGLRRRSEAARLLRSWVRIPPWAWMFVCCICCVCCQVEVSATSWSLVQRSPTDCGASLCVI